jgi:hypothetical protein
VLPTDTDRRLGRYERWKTYSETLVNVGIVGAGVRSFLELVHGAAWTFKPADEKNAAAVEVADFITDALLEDMATSWSKVMRRAATAKFWGFSIQEWSMKQREDGRRGFKDIQMRPCHTIERWNVDANGVVVGVAQRSANTGREIYLPIEKVLYLVEDTLSDTPEGLGIFRHLIRLAAGYGRLEDLEHWGFENDLNGIPVVRVPLGELRTAVANSQITEAEMLRQVNWAQSFVANHRKGPSGGVVLDSASYETTDEKRTPSSVRKWEIETMKSDASSHVAVGEAIKRKTWELARLLCCEHLLLGADGSGSLALHQSATLRLHAAVNTCLDELRDASQKQLVARLCMLNEIPRELWPKAKPEKIAYRTVEEVTGALRDMAQAGVPLMPTDPAVGEVRDMIGLSRPEMSDVIMSGVLAMLPAAAAGAPGEPDAEDGEGDDEKGDQKRTGGAGRQGSRRKAPGGSNPMTAILGELQAHLSAGAG